jgi:hypothetical protein
LLTRLVGASGRPRGDRFWQKSRMAQRVFGEDLDAGSAGPMGLHQARLCIFSLNFNGLDCKKAIKIRIESKKIVRRMAKSMN